MSGPRFTCLFSKLSSDTSRMWFTPLRCEPLFSLITPLSSCMARRQNSNRSSIAKIGRTTYAYLYPTTLVNPDGSTITIRYKEPRRLITLPLDLTTLTEEEQRLRIAKRRPKTKVKVEEEIDVSFDASKYLGFGRKRK